MDENNTVLSYSSNQDVLVRRESALRNAGFRVVSVPTENQARFEIEMGRCGIMVICSRTKADAIDDLTNLFRQYCPVGIIVFVMHSANESAPRNVDYIVSESGGPEAILHALRSAPPAAKAS